MFFQWWKAIYGFFHCSRSPSENDICKNNLIACSQRWYILKINWAVQQSAPMTAPHGQYAEKWQFLWEHSPSNEWGTQLEHDVGTWASMRQCLPLGVQQGVLFRFSESCVVSPFHQSHFLEKLDLLRSNQSAEDETLCRVRKTGKSQTSVFWRLFPANVPGYTFRI